MTRGPTGLGAVGSFDVVPFSKSSTITSIAMSVDLGAGVSRGGFRREGGGGYMGAPTAMSYVVPSSQSKICHGRRARRSGRMRALT